METKQTDIRPKPAEDTENVEEKKTGSSLIKGKTAMPSTRSTGAETGSSIISWEWIT